LRFNKSISNNNDDDNNRQAVPSSPSHWQTNSTNSHENRLVHIDTVKVDEKSRLVLTKKAKDILHIQPKDVVVIYHDSVNNHAILKVQRGANNNIVDSWILKRNVLVGYTYAYKNEETNTSTISSSSTNNMNQYNTKQQQYEQQEHTESFNIMLIDDEPDVLLTLKSVISSQGNNVEAFGDSQEALKRFLHVSNKANKDSNASYYKLIITDIRMRGLNGVQLYQILKALDKNVKILFISGLDSAEEIISVLPNVTLNDIIKKPIEADRLNPIIRTALLSY
jgi:CheY-like chemotaxis protein